MMETLVSTLVGLPLFLRDTEYHITAKQTGIYSMKTNNQNKPKGKDLMNRKKIRSTVVISILLISVALAAAPVQAGVFFTVSGTLYVDDGSGFAPVGAGVEVILSFVGGNYSGLTNAIGYYEVNDNMPVETGCLFVNLSGIIYSAEDAQGNNVCIQVVPTPPYIDNLDLYVNTSQAPPPNNPPNVPNTPDPYDGETGVDVNHDLSWVGGDPDIPDTVTYDIYFGTTTSPAKIVTNNSGPSYDPGQLTSNTTYYWKIVAWDDHGASTDGPEWNFTAGANNPPNKPTLNSPADGSTVGSETSATLKVDVTDPDGDTMDVKFYNANGDAYIGEDTGVTDGGTASFTWSGRTQDTTYQWYAVADDGEFTNQSDTWSFKTKNFGDGTTGSGETVTHSYDEPDTYVITLTVTGPGGSNSSTTSAVILPKLNNPPIAPEVTGEQDGTKNTDYNYTAMSTDDDNDTLQYTFDWGDDTNSTTGFVANGTAVTEAHNWSTWGIYTVSVNAYDNDTYSVSTEYVVLIDVLYVKNIGYLIDTDSDDTYDSFYSNETLEQTSVEKLANGSYLINSDSDAEWDWIYEPPTDTLTSYSSGEDEPDNTIWYMLGLGIILAILLLLGIYYYIKKKEASKKKQQKKNTKKK